MSKLYFYHSAMNSGKSAHIIMQIYNLKNQGYKVLTMKPKIDTRDVGVIKSRALQSTVECELISDDTKIFELVKESKPEYVFVDEVNFLTNSNVEELARIVDELNIPVFAYGLLVDYKGELFIGSKRMIELSDSIRELKAPCTMCKRKAKMHLRKVDGDYIFKGDSIQIGDTDTYDSVCRTCYFKVKNKCNK